MSLFYVILSVSMLLNFSVSSNCTNIRQRLSMFDPIFKKITQDMDLALERKYNLMSFEEAAQKNAKLRDPSEKKFINVFTNLGLNNVSLVSKFTLRICIG